MLHKLPQISYSQYTITHSYMYTSCPSARVYNGNARIQDFGDSIIYTLWPVSITQPMVMFSKFCMILKKNTILVHLTNEQIQYCKTNSIVVEQKLKLTLFKQSATHHLPLCGHTSNLYPTQVITKTCVICSCDPTCKKNHFPADTWCCTAPNIKI